MYSLYSNKCTLVLTATYYTGRGRLNRTASGNGDCFFVPPSRMFSHSKSDPCPDSSIPIPPLAFTPATRVDRPALRFCSGDSSPSGLGSMENVFPDGCR